MTTLETLQYWLNHPATMMLVAIIMGSFANVVVSRLPKSDHLSALAWPGSHCMACGTPIAWYDLIPVFSWLRLRGKSRCCQTRIPWRYVFLEIAIPAWMALMLWCHAPDVAGAWFAFGAMVLIAACIDAENELLPNTLTAPLVVTGIFSHWLLGWSVIDAVLGAILGYVTFALADYLMIRGRPGASSGDGIGIGDWRYAAGLGAWLGASWVGGFIMISGILGVLQAKLDQKNSFPFAPHMSIAALGMVLCWSFGWIG